jgi:phosphatidylglycerophosphatase C
MVLALDHADHYIYSRIDVQKEKAVKKGIAFFDFDGTITTKDTLLVFIRYCKGTLPFYIGFLLNSPWLVAYKLKIISNQKAKERVLRYFFKGTTAEAFDEYCRKFANEAIPPLIRPGALEEIKKLQTEGVTVVIVSASPANWVTRWAEKHGLLTIATILETKGGKLTGHIVDKNCHGEEKVCRIEKQYTLSDYETVYAYGDSSGDKPMLNLAKYKHYKPFR